MWTIVLPRAWKSGVARFRSASSPPTMIASRASIAPTSPPDTGASSVRNGGRFVAARFARSRVAAGLMVLMSIASSPSWAPLAMPSGPNMTASTSGVLVTIVTTMSLRSATSRGVRTAVAPASASGFARSIVRFVTVTANPALSALRAIGVPMIPRPTNPTRSIIGLVVLDVVVTREEDAAIAGLFGHQERSFLGLIHVHRGDQELVGNVDEALRARELVRDGLGERILLEGVEEQRACLLHEREEFERFETALVRDQHGGAAALIASMDRIEEH